MLEDYENEDFYDAESEEAEYLRGATDGEHAGRIAYLTGRSSVAVSEPTGSRYEEGYSDGWTAGYRAAMRHDAALDDLGVS